MELIKETIAGIVMIFFTVSFVALVGWWIYKREKGAAFVTALTKHFRPRPLLDLKIVERQFPTLMRADLLQAIESYMEKTNVDYFTGIDSNEMGIGGVDFSSLFNKSLINMTGASPGPPQYEQVDIGDDDPVSVLKNGLWLIRHDNVPLGILCAPTTSYGGCGIEQSIKLQVASPSEATDAKFADEFFKVIEGAVERAACYRGKVLSLEQASEFRGQTSGVRVHRLAPIPKEQVILPNKTLELLERNVIEFIDQREKLASCGMTLKKGLLFYGPPGTGKTHTIRYLASQLQGHTTFLISSEQIGLLSEYMTLARLLQPSIVVIEDVDLIGRDRARSQNAGTESMLNKLLNEMDGLREDSAIIFILTTNRANDLEEALASRPGRVDQAIEFPRPDDVGRKKLVELYSRSLEVPDALLKQIVSRTDGVTASFIKELMRRVAQRGFVKREDGIATEEDVNEALEEMLFSGGSLNSRLLGGGDTHE